VLDEARTIAATFGQLAEAELVFLARGWLLLYVLRRQLDAASRRSDGDDLASPSPVRDMTVAFVDVVGYSELARTLDHARLAELVGAFQQRAFDTVAESGGRVVKLIGDEVMLVGQRTAGIVDAALI